MGKYIVSSSPHITSSATTQKIMLDVVIALIPATLASVFLYGFYPLFLMILCVASAVIAEWLFNLIAKRPQSVRDLSAVVTGMILSLNLSPAVPFYVPMVGAFFAIIVVKMLFGGIGRNFANPAVTARIFLMLCWTGVMTKFVAPIDLSDGANLFSLFGNIVNIPDGITSATPLGLIKEAIEANSNPSAGLNALDMFLGRIGGSAGEVCTLAVLIGGIYLAARKVIDIKIPLLYIGSTAVFTAIFFANTGYAGEYVWTYLLSGGLMFGAVFMATDYATSPKSAVAVVIYGIGLGFLTVVIRKYGSMNEGVSFAILLMNILTPLLDKIMPRAFGKPKRDFAKEISAKKLERAAKKAQKADNTENAGADVAASAAKGGNNG